MTNKEIEIYASSLIEQMSKCYGFPEVSCGWFGDCEDLLHVCWMGQNKSILSFPRPERPDEKWFLLLGFSICEFLLKKHFERSPNSPV